MPRFDLPRDEIFSVDNVELLLDPSPLPFAVANRDAIAARWEDEKRAQPALFNGKVLMFSQMRVAGRRMNGRCHLTDFATLLYFRAVRPQPDIMHCFCHAALVSSDNALVAIRMAQRTASPGKVYFAAGSFDEADLRDGALALNGNMEREVAEETGLDLGTVAHEAVYNVLATESGTVIFRRYFLTETADAIAERIRAHVAGDPDPEIDGPVILRDAAAEPEGLLPHMRVFRNWHFATPLSI